MSTAPPERALKELLAGIESKGLAGYDPFDALNSPLLRALCLGLKWPRIALIQALRRCPVNLRPLLLVPRGINPKGTALFAESFALLGETEQTRRLLKLLSGFAVKEGETEGYGYNFPWQSRVFYLPPRTPTAVNTSFAGGALLAGYDLLGEEPLLGRAAACARFIQKRLNRIETGRGFLVSYSPLDRVAALNASALAGALCAEVGRRTGDVGTERFGRALLETVASLQRPDGSWVYGLGGPMGYVDSFHTGYVLRSLIAAGGHGEAVERGYRYWKESCFEPDGGARFGPQRPFPRESHTYAVAVLTALDAGDRELAGRLYGKWVEELWLGDRFAFAKGRFLTNRVDYIRWVQAWAFRALVGMVEV